jgi:hypothetical protein
MLKSVVQSIGIFMLVQFAMRQIMPGQQSTASVSTDSGSAGAVAPSIKTGPIPAFQDRPAQYDPEARYTLIPQSIAPIWPVNTPLDINIYVTPSMVLASGMWLPKSSLWMEEKAFGFGD